MIDDREALLRICFDAHPQPMWVFEVETLRFLAVNDAAVARYGYSRQQFLAMTLRDIRSAAELPALLRAVEGLQPGVQNSGLARHRLQDGREIDVEIVSHDVVFGARPARLVMVRDVSGWKLAQQALRASEADLRASEARLRAIFDAAPECVKLVDSDSTLLDINPAGVRMMGARAASELIGRRIEDRVVPEDKAAYHHSLARVFAGEPSRLRYRFRDLRDQEHHVESHATRVTLDGREVALALTRDVTERIRAEQELERKEALLRLAGRVARVAGWTVETDGSIYWSDQLFEMLEFPIGQLPSLEQALALYPEDSRARIETALQACLTAGTPFQLELQVRTRSGRLLWARCQGEAERDASATIVRARGAFQDITAEREVAEREREAERRLLATLETLDEGFFMLDPEWRFTYVNAAGERLLRRGRLDLLGRDVFEEFPGSDEFERAYRDANARREVVELEAFYAPLGQWFEVRATPVPEGLAVQFRDVSERRLAREALRASEERFRLLAEAASDAIWDWNLVTDALWWSEGFERLFGYRRAEVEPTIESWSSRVHPEERDSVVAALDAAIQAGRDYWSGEYRFQHADGRFVYVLDRGHVIRDDAGRPVRMVGGLTDISERKRYEDALVERAALIDAVPDAIVLRDVEDRIVGWNRGAEKLYGWTLAEVTGREAEELLGNDRIPEAREALRSTGHWEGEIRRRARDGRELTVEVRSTLLRDAAGHVKGVLGIHTDVTERRALEQQVMRSQRLEGIGTLAGGIAHDLNNVLAPILMAIEILRRGTTEARQLRHLQTIEQSARRGADLVRQV
ncbi:MAG: PAS domain S-box protein, partial [Vicinamibacteria bacterium]|nr:PAS domain S-box protein [Vicinamibacteria bacterium]